MLERSMALGVGQSTNQGQSSDDFQKKTGIKPCEENVVRIKIEWKIKREARRGVISDLSSSDQSLGQPRAFMFSQSLHSHGNISSNLQKL